MRVNFGVYLSACRQPGLSDTPDDPGTVTIYHFGGKYTILKQKKTRLWERVKSQGKQTKRTIQNIAGSLRNCSTPNISLNSGLVNILYPPHEHIFAKGVFHSVYPGSN